MNSQAQILIVEEEAAVASLHETYLQKAGFMTSFLERGDDTISYIRNHHVDLILLDINYSGVDGYSLCRDIRSFSNIPVIIVSAQAKDVDRFLGFEFGADDYIIKPFDPDEVIARVTIALRRACTMRQNDNESIRIDELYLDEERKKLFVKNIDSRVTMMEFGIMKRFMRRPGRVFDRAELIASMQNDGEHYIVSNRVVDSHIKNLRKKIAQHASDKVFIHSMYGAGYRFAPEM